MSDLEMKALMVIVGLFGALFLAMRVNAWMKDAQKNTCGHGVGNTTYSSSPHGPDGYERQPFQVWQEDNDDHTPHMCRGSEQPEHEMTVVEKRFAEGKGLPLSGAERQREEDIDRYLSNLRGR